MVAEIKISKNNYPYTICEFSNKLDRDEKLKIATQMEYMDRYFNHVEKMLDDGLHIATLLENMKILANIKNEYDCKLMERK